MSSSRDSRHDTDDIAPNTSRLAWCPKIQRNQIEGVTTTTTTTTTMPCNSRERQEESLTEESSNRWKRCGCGVRHVVFALTLTASLVTFVASWSCFMFSGAELFYGGTSYGIWTLEDSNRQCRLWSVLFVGYNLDIPLRIARFCSMVAMLASLIIIPFQMQLFPIFGRKVGWFVGAIGLHAWLIQPLANRWGFSVWTTFFILTYMLVFLLIKVFVMTRCSPRTLYKVVRGLAILCTVMALGMFSILASEVCVCDSLDMNDLTAEGGGRSRPFRYPSASNSEDCNNHCVLGPGSHRVVATPCLWFVAALLAYIKVPLEQFSDVPDSQQSQDEGEPGISQPSTTPSSSSSSGQLPHPEEEDSRQSAIIDTHDTTRDCHFTLAGFRSTRKNGSEKSLTQRQRLDTATTFNSDDCHDNDKDDEDGGDAENKDTNDRNDLDCSDNLETDRDPSHPVESSLVQRTDRSDLTITTVPTMTTIVETDNCHEEGIEDGDSDCNLEFPCSSHLGTTRVQSEENIMDHDDGQRDVSDGMNPSGTSAVPGDPNLCPKDRSSRVGWCSRICLVIVGVLYTFNVTILLGSFFENRRAFFAKDTSPYFITKVVCAYDPRDNDHFQTFDSPDLAHLAGFQIAHCGACAECSNPYDIQTYVETRKTVANKAKKCSSVAIFGKEEALHTCLEEEIGFSPGCTTCWAENMKRTAKKCMWTCLSAIITGFGKSNTVPGATDFDLLNQCVYCDEKRSGPDFVTCSGVARRRLGIKSEFERNPKEQCPFVDVDYLDSNWTKAFDVLET